MKLLRILIVCLIISLLGFAIEKQIEESILIKIIYEDNNKIISKMCVDGYVILLIEDKVFVDVTVINQVIPTDIECDDSDDKIAGYNFYNL